MRNPKRKKGNLYSHPYNEFNGALNQSYVWLFANILFSFILKGMMAIVITDLWDT